MSKRSEKKVRKKNLLRSFKNLFCVLIIFSLVLFQVFWFISIRNLEVSFDLSNYERFNESIDFQNYIRSLFDYMGDNPHYINDSAVKVLENHTLINEIEEEINSTINSPKDIYNAYLDGKITKELILDFIKNTWNYAIEILPERYFRPAYIIITNQGWAQIINVSLKGNILLEGKQALFLKNVNNVLGFNQSLQLNITIANLIRAISSVSFPHLVNITLNFLERTGTVENLFTYYLKQLASIYDLDLNLLGKGIGGFFPISIVLNVSLNPIIKNL